MEVFGFVGDAPIKIVERSSQEFMAKVGWSCRTEQQQGFALLLVLLLLSLMVVLVFSVSYRSTLDAREFHFRYRQLQKQEIIKSSVNICSAWLKSKPSSSELKFTIQDTECVAKVILFENSFNINELLMNRDHSTMVKFDEALVQDKLSPYKDSIIDLVQQRGAPWVNIEDLYRTLAIPTDARSSFLPKALSTHPSGSLQLNLELIFVDGSHQKRSIYYYPSPSGPIPVSQIANYDVP